jgi:hypothetical protein
MSVGPTVTVSCAQVAVGIAIGSAINPASIVNRASVLNIGHLPNWNRLVPAFLLLLTKRSATAQPFVPDEGREGGVASLRCSPNNAAPVHGFFLERHQPRCAMPARLQVQPASWHTGVDEVTKQAFE